MDIVVIYKQDGTVQCHPEILPRTLSHDEANLRKIGVQNICASGNVLGPIMAPQWCGAPTSQVNAIAISDPDWQSLSHGIVGTLGFRLWIGAPVPQLDWTEESVSNAQPIPTAALMSVSMMPALIRDLIGRPVRCYAQGDSIEEDFVPDRVNIEHDAAKRISNIWFG